MSTRQAKDENNQSQKAISFSVRYMDSPMVAANKRTFLTLENNLIVLGLP
jgi:hypothetical protein